MVSQLSSLDRSTTRCWLPLAGEYGRRITCSMRMRAAALGCRVEELCARHIPHAATTPNFALYVEVSAAVSPCRDTYVRIYDAGKNAVKGKYQHRAPVLDAAFVDEGKVASGGLDQSIKMFDIETGRESVLGAHSAPVRCVEHAPEQSASFLQSEKAALVCRVWRSAIPLDQPFHQWVCLPRFPFVLVFLSCRRRVDRLLGQQRAAVGPAQARQRGNQDDGALQGLLHVARSRERHYRRGLR